MENFERQLAEMKGAIDLCVSKRFILPSLTLIYSAMDVCAWLEFNDAQVGARFEKWCDQRLIPDTNLLVAGVDLYGARCGIVHSFMSASSKSRSGKARQVIYGWGKSDYRMLQELTDLAGIEGYVSVQLEDLRDALFDAMDRLVATVYESEEILEKAREWLGHQSHEDTEEMLRIAREHGKGV